MHCKDPNRCSVCSGAPVRRVTVVHGLVLVDGVVTRRAEPVTSYRALQRKRRE